VREKGLLQNPERERGSGKAHRGIRRQRHGGSVRKAKLWRIAAKEAGMKEKSLTSAA